MNEIIGIVAVVGFVGYFVVAPKLNSFHQWRERRKWERGGWRDRR